MLAWRYFSSLSITQPAWTSATRKHLIKMLLWYLFIGSNLYHTHHTHRSGSCDWQIRLLLQQYCLPQTHPPCSPLPYQHNCCPLDTAVTLNKTLSAFIKPYSTLQNAGGVSKIQEPHQELGTHLWCFVARYSWVQPSATAELNPGAGWQPDSASGRETKWLCKVPRIIPETLCMLGTVVQKPAW